jgi:glycosyltransferase involved in cell wall biosynthesis
LHRCRGSTAEAAVYATALSRQQPRLLNATDRFIAVSRFTAARSIKLGLPADRTVALAHFAPAAEVATASLAADGRYGLASGRLVPEKGFDTAIEAARRAGAPLVIAGDGPDAARLRRLAAGADVRFAGQVSRATLVQLRRGAAFSLMPSRCDESLGYAALEALADGVPVIGSDRGGLPELLRSQIAIDPDDQPAWNRQVARLWGDRAQRGRLGARALETARSQLSEERYLERLLEIYAQARVNRRPATGD